MQSHSLSYLRNLLNWTAISSVLWGTLAAAQTTEYLTPNDVVLPPEAASQTALNLSQNQNVLRFAGLDVFPRAAVSARYDDNLVIGTSAKLSDFEWTLSPGLTIAAGDVSTSLPGSVTLRRLRNLLNYSISEDTSLPQRFLGVEYSPDINLFSQHSEFDNVDHRAGLSAGYGLARLALGLDQDFSRVAEKDASVGSRVTSSSYTTRLTSRYEFSDRSALEVNGSYYVLDYANPAYQGYHEFRNEDWFDRQVGARLNAGVGLAFGFVSPSVNPSQTYQEAMLRGTYLLTGKLYLQSSLGLEWRQYDGGVSDTVSPTFRVATIYRPRAKTTLTLEGHRRDEPSPTGFYNYETIGFSVGVGQAIGRRFQANLTAGYDSVDYLLLQAGQTSRSDDRFRAQASLDYDFIPHWKARLYYSYMREGSNLPRYRYSNNVVGAQVAWEF